MSVRSNVVVVEVVGTTLLYRGVELRHVMEKQGIVIIGESIRLASLVLIGFYELLLCEERF